MERSDISLRTTANPEFTGEVRNIALNISQDRHHPNDGKNPRVLLVKQDSHSPERERDVLLKKKVSNNGLDHNTEIRTLFYVRSRI